MHEFTKQDKEESKMCQYYIVAKSRKVERWHFQEIKYALCSCSIDVLLQRENLEKEKPKREAGPDSTVAHLPC